MQPPRRRPERPGRGRRAGEGADRRQARDPLLRRRHPGAGPAAVGPHGRRARRRRRPRSRWTTSPRARTGSPAARGCATPGRCPERSSRGPTARPSRSSRPTTTARVTRAGGSGWRRRWCTRTWRPASGWCRSAPSPTAPTSSARGAPSWSPSGPCSGSASTSCGCPRPVSCPRRGRWRSPLGIDAKSYVARVRAAGDRAFVEAIVLRSQEARAALRSGAGDVPGVAMVRDTLPLAPTRDFARPVLGTFGAVTAEIVKESDGTYVAGDEAGLSGLQARYDEQLRGTPGLRVRRARGKDLFTVDPVPGKPLRTTAGRPAAAARGAHPGRRTARQRAGRDPAVDGRPAGGGQRPGVGGLLDRDGRAVRTRLDVQGGQQPGAAALRGRARPPRWPARRPRWWTASGSRTTTTTRPTASGEISFATAVANSCNTAFIGQRDAVTQAEVADAAASLGLGVDHDLGFPAYFGSVPATAAEAGSDTGRAASLIGQGKVLASPMAMAAVAASVARGQVVVPRLLPAQKTDDAAATHTPDRSGGGAAAVPDARGGHPRQRLLPGLGARARRCWPRPAPRSSAPGRRCRPTRG